MGLISVITIVRNDAEGLKKTRASIGEQSLHPSEWLIVDGASTDGTVGVLRDIDEPYATVISEPDRGIYDAMNKGLERASGEFVLFLNAGDAFANRGILRDVAGRLEEGGVDLLYGDSFEAFGGERLVYKPAQGHGRVSYGMFACHQSIYYRRSLIGTLRYDTSYRVAGDYCFTAQFLKKRPRIQRVHHALCVFDLTGVSLLNRRRGREENWRVQREVLGLSLPRRCAIRAAYLGTAFLAVRMPRLYRALRFRSQGGY